MRIGIFTNNYIPIISGVTESIESFRKELEARGHEIFIFAPRFPGHKDDNPNVFRYPSINYQHKTPFPIAITCSRKIFKKVEELNLDIIHSQHPFNVGQSALKIARKLNLPIIFTNHCRYDIYTHFIPLIPQKLLKWYVKRTAVNYANKCDTVISPTQSIKEMLIEWGMRTRIEVIPTGTDIEKFKNAKSGKIREELKISSSAKATADKQNKILLMTISRLAEEKNVDFLIRSFAGMKNDNLHFIIVGGGHYKEALEKLADDLSVRDKITFTGAIPHADIPKYFKASDIFVYASLSETQGIMITEAMASGLPVVAVKAPGAMDLIESGVDGILSPEIEEAFITRVESLINNPEKRKQIAEQAVKSSESVSVESCVDKLEGTYENLRKSIR